MTVKPTTAYVGDNTEGKLTLYVPYYGVTGIGQITLSASGAGNVQLHSNQLPMEVLTKSATDNSASVTFSLEGDDAYSSSGRVLIDNDYTLKNLQEHSDGKSYEEGCGFSSQLSSNGSDGWITTNGSLTSNGDGTYTQHFTLAENTSTTSPRTGAVVVFSPSGREVTRFVIKQNAKDAETIKPTSLVTDKSANCYIITSPGTYELPAYMGAHNSLTGQKKYTGKPYEVWNDGNNTINLLYKSFSDNKIVFEIPNQIKAGNAVIAIRDENDVIQWSWHLWFCTDDPRTSSKLQNYEVTTSNNQTVTYSVMNRNLGASSYDGIDLSSFISGASYAFVWHSGLYYQWGRKDPLRNQSLVIDDVTSLEYSTSTKNPSIFYSAWEADGAGWAETKTKDDPCPPGYKVPPTNIWAKSDEDINRTINMQEGFFMYDLVTQKLYPYSGYIDSSGNYHDGTEGESVNRQYPILTKIAPAYFPASTERFSTKPSYTPMQYCNFYFDAIDMTEVGGLWGCNDQMFEYGYDTNGARITGYEYRSGTWKQGGILSKYYYASYPVNTKDYIQVNEYPHSSLSEENANTILQTLIIPYVDFLNIGSLFIDKKIYSKGALDHATGLQVRCAVDQ